MKEFDESDHPDETWRPVVDASAPDRGPSDDGPSDGGVSLPGGLAPALDESLQMSGDTVGEPVAGCPAKPKKKIPIVFVPGVMGSRLHFTAIDQYWDPDSTWRMWHWIRIGADRYRREAFYTQPAQVVSDGNDKGWSGVAKDFYRGILKFLNGLAFASADTPVYAAGYDWRQDNLKSGAYVTSKVNEYMGKEGASQCILVSHSMGGLVTRSAMQNGLAGNVLAAIHVFQPATGAAVLYRRFFTGSTSGLDGMIMGYLMGDTPEKVVKIVSGLVGPVQLLPTNDYRDTNNQPWLQYRHNGQGGRWSGDVYDLYQRTAQSPPGLLDETEYTSAELVPVKNDLMNRVREAKAFHSQLGLYKHPETWALYGTGNNTDMAIMFDPPVSPHEPRVDIVVTPDGSVLTYDYWPDRGAQPQRRDEGDGTVPGTSGSALFSAGQTTPDVTGQEFRNNGSMRQGLATGVVHDQACNASVVQRMIYDILNKVL